MNCGHSEAREIQTKHTVVSDSISYVFPLKLMGKGTETGKRRRLDFSVIWCAEG